MQSAPVIFLIADPAADASPQLAETLRRRYQDGFRVEVAPPETALASAARVCQTQAEPAAAFVVEWAGDTTSIAALLESCLALCQGARGLLLMSALDDSAETLLINPLIHALEAPWFPAETRLYPLLDEVLADWRSAAHMPFERVKGVMTLRAVRIRLSDTLHRAAEVIALSGVGDLMVIDEDNRFAGVLSVGDVLRAAMPDIEEILAQGGTLDQAFWLFLRKGSELKYKPVAPLVIRNPLVVDPDDHVAKAAALMLQKNIHRLPVVKDGRLVGTVGRADVCQAVVGTL
jgi:CBS domain-containing protein